MKLRKQRSTREVSINEDSQNDQDMGPFELADWAPSPEELYRDSELRNILRNTLQELPPSLKVVFVLRDIEGLLTEETAEVLELTPVAVKARLWRARLQLRERLSKYFGDRTFGTGINIRKVQQNQREFCTEKTGMCIANQC
jgi:RNA polymerase sigma-70 factor (ECF subfamily)